MKTGGCLCGAVRYELRGATTSVTYCHCSMCRRWHGHLGTYSAVERSDFVLTKDGSLKWYGSSEHIRRGFCGDCGSSLFFDDPSDSKIGLCAGSLDEPTGLRSTAHIYVASKGDYYDLADDGLRRFDAAPEPRITGVR